MDKVCSTYNFNKREGRFRNLKGDKVILVLEDISEKQFDLIDQFACALEKEAQENIQTTAMEGGKRCRFADIPECAFYPACACGHSESSGNGSAESGA